jgi:hypothetical protein
MFATKSLWGKNAPRYSPNIGKTFLHESRNGKTGMPPSGNGTTSQYLQETKKVMFNHQSEVISGFNLKQINQISGIAEVIFDKFDSVKSEIGHLFCPIGYLVK